MPGKKIEKCWYIKVLRYNRIRKVAYLLGFNNNIRCIETKLEVCIYGQNEGFNNNIRCIETYFDEDDIKVGESLITT